VTYIDIQLSICASRDTKVQSLTAYRMHSLRSLTCYEVALWGCCKPHAIDNICGRRLNLPRTAPPGLTCSRLHSKRSKSIVQLSRARRVRTGTIMDIFVRNIPDQASNKNLEIFFQKQFRPFSIDDFSCQKLKTRGCAILTVLDAEKRLQVTRPISKVARPLRSS
jgi:hypothetical protein